MYLNRKQFDILSIFAEKNEYFDVCQISNKTGYPLEIVEECISEFIKCGYLLDFKITSKGLEVLEPYKVKRAIFLAAGLGNRLKPITLNTPKPLIRVFGERIIDRLIDAVLDVGI